MADAFTDKYLKIYLKSIAGNGDIYFITFSRLSDLLDDPDTSAASELALNNEVNGCFCGKDRIDGDMLLDDFILKGIETDEIYKLSIDMDYENFNFLKNKSLIVTYKDNNISDWIIHKFFYTKNRLVYYFSIPDNIIEPSTITLSGFLGIKYRIRNEHETKDFIADSYEPDNGPISENPDVIHAPGTSQVHTIAKGNEDWIQFFPSGTSSDEYSLYIILEDTLYDVDTKDDFDLYFDVALVNPNGSSIEGKGTCYFNMVPVSAIQKGFILYKIIRGFHKNC